MRTNNAQAIEEFLKWNIKARSKHIFSEYSKQGIILYSYGYHFPLAIYRGGGVLYINKNRYSQTTSCHRGILKRQAIRGGYNIIEKSTDELQTIIKGKNCIKAICKNII